MKNQLMHISALCFSDLMKAYVEAGEAFKYCIDGGAGAGDTALRMLPYLEDKGKIYAFEPFPGNFRFFDSLGNANSTRIRLIKKALYRDQCKKNFFVSSTVQPDQPWGKQGKEGYSSVGRLIDNQDRANNKNKYFIVDCIAADQAIRPQHKVDFIKLDLQGGELDALMGMNRIITEPHFMWVEFSNQPGLLDFLYENGFIIFETIYLFKGQPLYNLDEFRVVGTTELSTGHTAWYGFHQIPWGPDFKDEFQLYRQKYGMIQTDIVCVHHTKYTNFIKIINSSFPNK